MKYNGWTNRETWVVNIWFEPQNVEDVEYAKEFLEDAYENIPDCLRDMCYLDCVNWEELRAHVAEE